MDENFYRLDGLGEADQKQQSKSKTFVCDSGRWEIDVYSQCRGCGSSLGGCYSGIDFVLVENHGGGSLG